MSPYFSIIVSAFNVENYVKDGLYLLSYQTFRDFEVIIIDDGSTDSTYVACSTYIAGNNNFNIFHQENMGLGNARNRGISLAKGKYICFYDLDDKVSSEWLERIFEILKNSDPDILIYGYREINLSIGTINEFQFEKKELMNNTEIGNNFVDSLSGMKFNNGFSWNKVYRSDFIRRNNLHFTFHTIQQDEIFNHKAYAKAEKIIISNEVLYYYFIRKAGNIRSRYIPDRITIFENVLQSFNTLAKHWDINDYRFLQYINERFLKNVLFNRNPIAGVQERLNYAREVIANPEVNKAIKKIKSLKEKQRKDIIYRLYIWGIQAKNIYIFVFLDWMICVLRKLHNNLKGRT